MYINTGQEVRRTTLESRTWADEQYDGSDSGARPDEAVSWGKIRAGAESVKVGLLLISLSLFLRQASIGCIRVDSQVYADATLVFPLVVAATFGKAHWSKSDPQ